ncbi:hypothetical protein Nepgr_025071 [Nepenthes gracilis]|uniref:Uncharacterized protein n=1 Tax=Nepenthes gracilis TaxID=150966 RepID=A0AAD3T5I6_NEPGR|nr:hypothetical protein Nepgr_025071 [Nepenthes gracilis]
MSFSSTPKSRDSTPYLVRANHFCIRRNHKTQKDDGPIEPPSHDIYGPTWHRPVILPLTRARDHFRLHRNHKTQKDDGPTEPRGHVIDGPTWHNPVILPPTRAGDHFRLRRTQKTQKDDGLIEPPGYVIYGPPWHRPVIVPPTRPGASHNALHSKNHVTSAFAEIMRLKKMMVQLNYPAMSFMDPCGTDHFCLHRNHKTQKYDDPIEPLGHVIYEPTRHRPVVLPPTRAGASRNPILSKNHIIPTFAKIMRLNSILGQGRSVNLPSVGSDNSRRADPCVGSNTKSHHFCLCGNHKTQKDVGPIEPPGHVICGPTLHSPVILPPTRAGVSCNPLHSKNHVIFAIAEITRLNSILGQGRSVILPSMGADTAQKTQCSNILTPSLELQAHMSEFGTILSFDQG